MSRFSLYWKAITGFITPGVVAVGYAVTAGSEGGTKVTQGEWIAAVVAMLVTGGVVYGAPRNAIPADHDLKD